MKKTIKIIKLNKQNTLLELKKKLGLVWDFTALMMKIQIKFKISLIYK